MNSAVVAPYVNWARTALTYWIVSPTDLGAQIADKGTTMDVQTLLMNNRSFPSNETNSQYDIYGFNMDWNKASLPADVADCEDAIAVNPLNTGYTRVRELI